MDPILTALVFGGYFAWMAVTTPEQRKVLFGYLMLLAVIAFFWTLISGVGPDYPGHY